MTGRYFRPATLAEAQAMRAEWGEGAVYGCGFTALQLAWEGCSPPLVAIDVSGLDFGPDARRDGGSVLLAANAPLQRLARDPLVVETLPTLQAALAALGSASVRNLASLGGNLMSGAGDLEVLFAGLGARAHFAGGASAPVETRHAWPRGGLLTAIEVAPDAPALYEKLGHRAAFSPARLVVAGARCADGVRAALRFAGGEVRCGEAAALVEPGDDAYLARVARALLAGHLAALAA